jgi:hypothetical protein
MVGASRRSEAHLPRGEHVMSQPQGAAKEVVTFYTDLA